MEHLFGHLRQVRVGPELTPRGKFGSNPNSPRVNSGSPDTDPNLPRVNSGWPDPGPNSASGTVRVRIRPTRIVPGVGFGYDSPKPELAWGKFGSVSDEPEFTRGEFRLDPNLPRGASSGPTRTCLRWQKVCFKNKTKCANLGRFWLAISHLETKQILVIWTDGSR